MDIERIAIVLHKAVLTKLHNEARIPETLTQDQAQASYDRVYDILQEAMTGRDLKIHKMDIQKEATLRSIQEIPLAIRDASTKPVEPQQSSGKPAQEEPASEQDIKDLVEQELKRRGMQDQEIGAVPPTPSLDTNTTQDKTLQPTLTNTQFLVPTPPNEPPPDSPPAPVYQRQETPSTSPTPTHSRSYTHTQAQQPTTLTTLLSSPTKGIDSLRWEFNTSKSLQGISRVHLPYHFLGNHPFLLLKIVNDNITITHPLIHTRHNWYDVPHGKKSMANLTGKLQITITDPNGDVISTKMSLRDAKTFKVEGYINPDTGVALPRDYTPPVKTQNDSKITEVSDNSGDAKSTDDEEDGKDGKDGKEDTDEVIHEKDENIISYDDDVTLLFKEHEFVIFFLSSST
jgi:hypothetical protein